MNIVIVTGAGISKESGIPTFRGSEGMWGDIDVSKFMTKKSLQTNMVETCNFYSERRKQLLSKEPNTAHYALAELENNPNHKVTIVTQNIDNLHEKAGSKNIIHMHGEINKLRSLADEDKIIECDGIHTDFTYRPHIVFFDEYVLGLDEIFFLLKGCQLFVSIGTSDNVQPACNFVNMVPKSNCEKVQINMEDTLFTRCYNKMYKGSCVETVPRFIKEYDL